MFLVGGLVCIGLAGPGRWALKDHMPQRGRGQVDSPATGS